MDLKLDFNPEEVAQALRETILKSTFAAMFEKQANAIIAEMAKENYWSSSHSGIQAVIRSYIGEQLRIILDDKFKDQIQAALLAYITKEKIDGWAQEAADKIQFRSGY